MWKTFDEKKEMAAILQKIPKPKIQPSRYLLIISIFPLFRINFEHVSFSRPPSEAGNSNSGADVQALLAQQQQQTPSSQATSLM